MGFPTGYGGITATYGLIDASFILTISATAHHDEIG
jgi:hypothetical protein